jgi:transcriptional regulator with XRE-family HTH domain
MRTNLLDTLFSTKDDKKGIQQEETIALFNELVYSLMEKEGVSKAELARRLGKSRSYITQLLDGSYNPTLRTASNIAFELGQSLTLVSARLGTVLNVQVNDECPEVGEYRFIHRKPSEKETAEDEFDDVLPEAA